MITKMTEENLNRILYLDNIKCNGCGKEFCVTVRADPDDENTKYCGTCYGHIVGIEEFSKVIAEMDLVTQTIWQTPTADLSDATKQQLNFIDKKRNVEIDNLNDELGLPTNEDSKT